MLPPIRFFLSFSVEIYQLHLPFSVAVRNSLDAFGHKLEIIGCYGYDM